MTTIPWREELRGLTPSMESQMGDLEGAYQQHHEDALRLEAEADQCRKEGRIDEERQLVLSALQEHSRAFVPFMALMDLVMNWSP